MRHAKHGWYFITSDKTFLPLNAQKYSESVSCVGQILDFVTLFEFQMSTYGNRYMSDLSLFQSYIRITVSLFT